MRYEQRARRATWFEVLVSSTMLKKVLLGGIGLPFLLQPATLQAQIAVDPNAGAAHRPDIVAAPNGVPSIDIVTPNGKGLSHNKYYDFNIGNPGVILNNHAQEVGQSQLGGIMPGNPHLRSSGSAKVILNEVTSSKRSALNGPAEVFGSPADVIIANPNGISCDGCGFINTPHATLTTGVPEIDGSGFLKGFEVQGGDITFGPQGANFFSGQGSVDIVDIVSRTVHFEGAVAGRTIGVTAGTGHFDYASRQMKELTDITGKPEYAIDGSALGALQADRIKLVATEKGVGVRMRHDMAANAGQLHLSADGKISLKDVFGHDGVVLQSKSDTLHAKHITSKKHVEIAAKKGITLETVGADGHLSVDAQDGLLTISGKATSGSNLELSSRHALQVSGLGAGADVILESGGALNIGGTVLAGGNLRAHAGGDIQAYFLAGGVDMAATQAAGSLVLGSHGDVDLQSGGGIINAANIYGAGNVTLVAYHGLSVSQTILSHQNVAIHVEPHAGIHFGQVLAHGRADIHGGAVDFSTMMTGDDAVLKVGSLDAGTLMTGLDFVHSQVSPSNPTGDLVFHDKGALSITAQRGVKVGHIISGGNIDLFAGNDIYYDQIIGYGTATLTSVSGGISVENVLSAKGDVRLTANTLDLSNNRSHIYTPQTLYLTADHIYVSGSKLIYGGLDFQSTNVLDIHHARLQAVTDEGGTGDILFVAPGVMVDEATSVLAARDFVIKTGELENSGQLAAGHDLAFSVRGDATNSKTGLIYVKGNGALQVDGALRNDFGAIVAEGDLSFTNADGTGKSLSLVNKAGFIQAGGNLNIQTNSLKNEADSTPVITEKTEEVAIAFEKPEGFDSIKNAILYHTTSIANELGMELWGVSYKEAECSGNTCNLHIKNSLANKEATYGKITLEDGIVYKAFTWKEENKSWLFFQGYRWNNLSHMIQKTVTQEFSPTRQGMIQSHGNLIINADTIDNHYSSIEAGGNADIHANVLTNLGATAYKNTYMGCQANTDAYCYAYNADGSRNVALDIINNDGFRQTGSKVLDSVSGLVQAGGTLNLVVDQLNNTAAKGSITGDAHFEAKTVEGNPLEDLSGLTGAGALFTPKVDLNNAGELSDGLPLPKPQSGGVGGTLPKQNFIYETRAEFLDVGKFYGSAYFLNRIGYNPDREIFFLGDAYFEKQLIEKQMRDLVGQGLGKGSFIPGSDAIEQVKNLLDVGADYAKTHNLTFGEPLSEEQLASLEAPMVIYVRQQVKGMDVYAPVLYIPEKDRASFVSAGALIMGDDVNITSQNTSNSTITNSGRIAANHQLHVHGGDILSQGGHFAAGGDAFLVAQKNIRLDAGRTTVDGVETVLNTDALSAGGNASVIAKQDLTASGVRITTKGDLAMATEQGNLTIGSAQTHYHSEQGDATMHHKSEVNSGGSTTLASGKDLNVLGSDVQTKDKLLLQAEGNVSIDATRNSMDNHTQDGQTSHVTLHNGSHLSSGKDTTVLSGQDIHIAASDIDAKGNVALGAQREITIGVRNDERDYHFQGSDFSIDRQESISLGSSIKSGGDTTVVAGQDGKAHDLSITGSSIAAEGKVGLKASNDILINNAEDSSHREISSYTDGGFFGGSSSYHETFGATQVVGSSIAGEKGVALESGNNTQIVASMLTAGKPGEITDQAKADITIHSGGKITIKGIQEHYDQQEQSSESSFLHEESSNSSQSHSTTVSSILGATGNIITQSDKETTITASHMFANEGIHVTGENVTIDGMTDHHENHSETHETGFGVGSGKGFVSVYGSESKTENEESFEHQGSSLNGKNITITATKKDVNVVGSDFTAQENIHVSAVHDINVSPGHNRHSASSKEERTGFGFQFEKNPSGASVGVGVASAKDTGDQWENTSVQSHITARQDVQIAAENDVNLQATIVSANRDVNIDAGNTITLSESYDTSNAQETHEKSFAGVTGSVNVGILGTVKDVKDAAKRFGHGDTKHKIGNGLIAGLKGYDLYSKGKGLYNGMKDGKLKQSVRDIADVSASVTVGFKTEKEEASVQTSTAVTDSIEGGRSINIHAHEGSIHSIGADIIAGTNPVYANDEQSGNITLDARQHILFESAQNTQSTQNRSESASMNIGYSYGTGGTGWMGNASFGKGKGSSEEVQQKNSHIIGTGTVHTSSGEDTTLAGAVVSANHVEMEVGRDLNITSRSDTGQSSSKQNSVSIGYNSREKDGTATTNISLNKDKSSSDYHSVVEQSGIKAGDGGFKINVKDKTTLTGGLISSTAPAEKNSLTTGSITTSDISNSAHAQASSDGISISAGGPMYQGKYGVGKNIAKNVLDHSKAKDSEEGYTKSAISDGTIVITDEAGQKALTGQDVEQAIASLNRDTATAHKGVQQLDVGKLEQIVHENREMATQLLEEGFKYSDESYKTMFIKEHPIAVVDRDEKGNIIYETDANGQYIKDARGQPIPHAHYLTDEEKEHLQEGADGKVHVFLNGIFTPPYEAAVYAVQHAKDKNVPLYFVVFPEADSAISELLVAGYQKFMENNFWGLTNSTQEAKDLTSRYGNTGLHFDAHSRGSLTGFNMMNSFKQEGVNDVAGNTTISFFGPAANVLAASGLLGYVSGGKQTTIGFDGNRYDFVSRWIGGNGYTYETIPAGSNWWTEWWRVIMNPVSSHTCLGDASYKCRYNYGTSHLEQKP
ncbi:hemagglutinin repeat-containing protein [Bartonella taylorii]|uniref:Hemagglutinin repeat-containing protein n=1 Tax=Bartonella taylorii TaxID=33046 RepID=A0A9Q8YZP3_BARTA|nr:hemagglutinin repeat-containing protein [Bartonella taylorii]USP03050.1 hemagglutinin repeat-containing protein [Bartonella taylorii]